MAMTHTEQWRSKATLPGWALVLASMAASYVGVFVVAPYASYWLNYAVLQPLFFLLPGGIALWLVRNDWQSLLPAQRTLPLIAGALAIVQIGLMVTAGVWLGGFGNSPYSHSLPMLLVNLWYIAALLVGHEVSRWYLVRALRGYNETVALVAVWLLFWFTQLSPYSFARLTKPDTLFEYVGLIVLPLAGRELLATRLTLAGGPTMALGYAGVLTLFEWLSPILPSPHWLASACLGIAIPIIGLALVDSLKDSQVAQEAPPVAEDKDAAKSGGISPLWLVTAVVALLIFWFNTGFFGVYPSLIHGISMEPKMHTGDVAIIHRVPTSELQVGDIVQFEQHGFYVIHRIIRIDDKDDHRTITTQGDNVYSPDEAVDEKAIKGKMMFFVPKIGWPIVAVKSRVESR